MQKLIFKLFDLRQGEGRKAGLMFFFSFLIISALSILKPVKNSMFLSRFGVDQLPYVFILVALFGAVIAVFYSRYSKKTRLPRLILMTLAVSIVCLIIFRIFLAAGKQDGWFLYLFYVWVAVFGVITGSQFWLLANEIFNAREAKRIFGFIGSGAISGGVFGGYLTNFLAPRLRSENLIFICIAFLSISIQLVIQIQKVEKTSRIKAFRRGKKAGGETDQQPFKLIFRSKHLLYMTGITTTAVIASNLIDFQFSAIASASIPDPDKLTAFFGFWLSTLNLISLIIQLFFTGRITKSLGITVSLLLLPIGIMFGAAAILLQPVLWSAVAIKLSDGGFKHSINKSGMELLTIPIPSDIKAKTKPFMDVVIKNFAKGIGGLMLIGMTVLLGFSIQHISLVLILLVAVWMIMILRIRKEYIESFRRAIEKRSINPEEQSLNINDASVFSNLLQGLEGNSERKILYTLNLLEGIKNKALVPHLKRLITHSSDEVKIQVLRMAPLFQELDITQEIQSLMTSSSPELQEEVVSFLFLISKNQIETLSDLLTNPEFSIRSAGLVCAAREWKTHKEFREQIKLEDIIKNQMEQFSSHSIHEKKRRKHMVRIARAIGETGSKDFKSYLKILLEDADPEVVKSAVIGAGRCPSDDFIPLLLDFIHARHLKRYARDSLASHGEAVLEILQNEIENPENPKTKRLAIPKVFALIDSQKSLNILQKNLEIQDPPLRYQIIRALNRIRNNFPLLKFEHKIIQTQIHDEINAYHGLLNAWAGTINPDSRNPSKRGRDALHTKAERLFYHAARERLNDALERIFRLLGLLYRAKDMYSAHLGLQSRNPSLRADSIEFLDNVVEPGLKRTLIPLVETWIPERIENDSSLMKKIPKLSQDRAFKYVLNGRDNWLKACIVFCIAVSGQSKYRKTMLSMQPDPDPLMQETLEFCLAQIMESSD